MRDYKWGILGPGAIARSFAKGLTTLKNAIPCAVGSRDLSRAQAFADEYGFQRAYGSYVELAGDPDVDVIYVATPHPFHADAVITCLEGGKAVVCEKPFAANAGQAARMIECARKNNVFLMEGMWTRFLPSIVKVRELISGGAIGPVRHVNADFGFRAGVNPESRLFAPALAGGSLLDVGIYNLSFCSMIFGGEGPERVQSHMNIGTTDVDETATVMLNYKGGQSALTISSIRLSTAHDAAIYGEEGFIKLPGYWHGNTVILSNKDGVQEMEFPFEPTGFQFEAAEVMSCLEKGLKECPIMPLDETLAIAKTLDKVRFDNHLTYPFEGGAV